MFEKTLADVIRGVRANKKNEAKYLSQALEDIRKELKSSDIDIKANAVNKLTYINMLGYDASWAAFNVIEVMASPKYSHKRIGYRAACTIFREKTDVLMLATNLLKKDMSSSNAFEASLALNGLANFMTLDLARDLSSDILVMMTHSRPLIRKKATLALYKVFLKYPDALRPAFPRLKDKLNDDDPSVVSAAVNVICELARKNPQNYVALAPQLFKTLTTSTNNWMLIKLIKLMGALCLIEKRLSAKLVEPLGNLLNTTPAVSLLYECINTVTLGMMDQVPLVKLSIQKLRGFIEDQDQNLKYLGLLTLGRFITDHPKIVAEHRDVILQCLDDADTSIRRRALDLLGGMVTKKTLPDIIKKLLSHLDAHTQDLVYRDEIVGRIVALSSQNSYQSITDFEWYYNILVHLSRLEGIAQGPLLGAQLLDVAIRVKVIRPAAVKAMASLLRDERFLQGGLKSANREVLYAAAWIVGEYASNVEVQGQVKIAELLLNPTLTFLPAHIQAAYIHNSTKIASIYFQNIEELDDNSFQFLNIIIDKLTPLGQSSHIEVQERACTALSLFKLLRSLHGEHPSMIKELGALFDGELNPVAPKAQKKVPVPEGLDLDSWINEPEPEEENRYDDTEFSFGGSAAHGGELSPASSTGRQASRGGESSDEEDRERRRQKRNEQRAADPFMLSGKTTRRGPVDYAVSNEDVDSIPIARLDLGDARLEVGESRSSRSGRRSRKEKEQEPSVKYAVMSREEMPEGAATSDDEDKKGPKKKRDALDIDLSRPLAANEQLLGIQAYSSPQEVKRIEEERMKQREAARKKEIEEASKRRAEESERRHRHRDDKDKKSSSSSSSRRDKERSDKDRSDKDRKERSSGDKTSSSEKLSSQRLSSSSSITADKPKSSSSSVAAPSPKSVHPADALLAELDIASPPSPKVASLTSPRAAQSSTTTPPKPSSSSSADKESKDKESKDKESKDKESKDKDAKRQSSSSSSSSRDRERSDRHSSSSSSSRHHGSDRHSSDRHSSDRHRSSRDEASKPSSSSSSSHRSSSSRKAEAASHEEVSGDQPVVWREPSRLRPLAANNHVALTFEWQTKATEPNECTLSVVIANRSSTLSLRAMEFSILDTMNVKLRESPDDLRIRYELHPETSNAFHMRFSIKDITKAQQLKGSFSYAAVNDDDQTSANLEFKIPVLVSYFVIAERMAPAQFAQLMDEPSNFSGKATTVVALNGRPAPKAAQAVAKLLHLQQVESGSNSTTLYGRSIQDHHVAALIKAADKGLSVEIKASSDSLANALLQEVNDFFQE